jgi:transposase-like protein
MNVRVWSAAEEEELLRLYCENDMSVTEIAEHFVKNNRSIISKLVQLKVYKKPNTNRKNKRSVKNMVIYLEKVLNIRLDGVNLSRKANLEILVDAIKLRFDQNTDLT